MQRDWNPNEPEMMDRPQPVSAELRRDLENLRGLNQHFGSYALVQHFLKRWLKPGKPYRLLDLCTGYGDIPRMAMDWAGQRKIDVTIDAVDFHPATLEIAREQSTAYSGIRYLQGDACSFSLPEGAPPYDLVFCSLALHHFSSEDAVRVLTRCRELASAPGAHTMVADLERSRFNCFGIWLVTATIYQDPMTQFDARLSARRAFSFHELRTLAQQAGWRNFEHKRFPMCRQAIWV